MHDAVRVADDLLHELCGEGVRGGVVLGDAGVLAEALLEPGILLQSLGELALVHAVVLVGVDLREQREHGVDLALGRQVLGGERREVRGAAILGGIARGLGGQATHGGVEQV